ncbi:hypothetical protein [Leptodesmis sp.]|uniref:hypothetical protein n=1 Tax=Leptodesmis sp. TaxID=3100501 RepID=UPI0040535A52
MAIASFQAISLLLLVKLSLPYLLKALDRAYVLAQNSDQITANDESVQVFFSTLKKVSANGIWLLTLILGGDFLHVPDILIKYLSVISQRCSQSVSGSFSRAVNDQTAVGHDQYSLSSQNGSSDRFTAAASLHDYSPLQKHLKMRDLFCGRGSGTASGWH